EATTSDDRELARTIDSTIARYTRAIRRTIHRASRGQELTTAEWRALQSVAALGSALGSTLARRTGVAPSTMSRTLDGLAARGFVRFATDPEDGNRVHAFITDAGQHALDAYETLADERLLRAIETLEPKQKERLREAMGDLRSALSRIPQAEAD